MFTEIYKVLRSYGVMSSLFNQDCQHFMNKTQISTLQIKYSMLVNFHLLGHVRVGGGGTKVVRGLVVVMVIKYRPSIGIW